MNKLSVEKYEGVDNRQSLLWNVYGDRKERYFGKHSVPRALREFFTYRAKFGEVSYDELQSIKFIWDYYIEDKSLECIAEESKLSISAVVSKLINAQYKLSLFWWWVEDSEINKFNKIILRETGSIVLLNSFKHFGISRFSDIIVSYPEWYVNRERINEVPNLNVEAIERLYLYLDSVTDIYGGGIYPTDFDYS